MPPTLRSWRALGVALALLLGLGLRFQGLDTKLFWHDEVYTRLFAAGVPAQEWKQILFSGQVLPLARVHALQQHRPDRSVVDTVRGLARDEPQHPPVYYVLARAWVSLLGGGVATLRALSALASLLSLPASFWLCLELFRSRRIAWIGAALVALSPFLLLYAQEAREYALWTAFVAASCAALLRALRRSAQPGTPARQLAWAWATFSLLTTLGLYTSFSMAAVVLAQVIFVLLRFRLRPGRPALLCAASMAASALLFLPWALTLLRHYEAFQASMAWSRTISVPRLQLLGILAQNLGRPVVDLWPDYGSLGCALSTGVALLLLLAALAALLRWAPRPALLLLLLLLLLPVALLLVPDLLLGGIRSLSARYLSPSLLAVLLALAFLLGTERLDRRLRAGLGALVFGLCVASSLNNAGKQVVWTKGISVSLPQAAAAVNSSHNPLVVGHWEHHHPGNLLALCGLLQPGASVQLLPSEGEYRLPDHDGDIFLFSPPGWRREALGLPATLLVEDLHLQLWRLPR